MHSLDFPTVDLRVGVDTLEFARLTAGELAQLVATVSPEECVTVVTPNLHHIALMREGRVQMERYHEPDVLLADGWPVAMALTVGSGETVERATGSDLLRAVLDLDGGGKTLVVVGGQHESDLTGLERTATAKGWGYVRHPAPRNAFGADGSPGANLLQWIASHSAPNAVVAIGVGSPKQEIIASELKRLGASGWVLCVGMGVDFANGTQSRAPILVRDLRLEWLHRLITEPRRLAGRYVADARHLIPLLRENWRARSTGSVAR